MVGALRSRGRALMAKTTDHIEEVHEAEALVAEVERAKAEVRDEARRALGVTGVAHDAPPPLRSVLREYKVSLYPLLAVGVLGTVDVFPTYAFAVLAPEISSALGIGNATIAGVIALRTL